ncbi:MAG: peptidase U34 [Crenarchaeota archaeon]|nr:peptidase U34 [Thermoproteota archaeon]
MVFVDKENTLLGMNVFAKNSDREPNEAQIIEYIPRMKHEESMVKLTYGEYPQARTTYAVLISRPWWTYGAEMGVNEYGLAIGNVAVFTKEPYSEEGILGMDILRLALERCRDAKEALDFIIQLIEDPGQGGNYAYGKKFRYHNSYLIVDPDQAWLLETAGKHWAAKKLIGFYTVSNALTIDDEWDMCSDNLVEHAVKEYRCSRSMFSFARCYSDRLYTWIAHGRERRKTTTEYLAQHIPRIHLNHLTDLLRFHEKEPYMPWKGSNRDICMHYGGLTRPSQTASSMIALLGRERQLVLLTLSSTPCLSMFKPLSLPAKPDLLPGGTATNKYSPENYWWKKEMIRRTMILRYPLLADYREQLYQKERILHDEAWDRFVKGENTWDIFKRSIKEEDKLEEQVIASITKFKPRAPFYYRWVIKKISRKAGLELR